MPRSPMGNPGYGNYDEGPYRQGDPGSARNGGYLGMGSGSRSPGGGEYIRGDRVELSTPRSIGSPSIAHPGPKKGKLLSRNGPRPTDTKGSLHMLAGGLNPNASGRIMTLRGNKVFNDDLNTSLGSHVAGRIPPPRQMPADR